MAEYSRQLKQTNMNAAQTMTPEQCNFLDRNGFKVNDCGFASRRFTGPRNPEAVTLSREATKLGFPKAKYTYQSELLIVILPR